MPKGMSRLMARLPRLSRAANRSLQADTVNKQDKENEETTQVDTRGALDLMDNHDVNDFEENFPFFKLDSRPVADASQVALSAPSNSDPCLAQSPVASSFTVEQDQDRPMTALEVLALELGLNPFGNESDTVAQSPVMAASGASPIEGVGSERPSAMGVHRSKGERHSPLESEDDFGNTVCPRGEEGSVGHAELANREWESNGANSFVSEDDVFAKAVEPTKPDLLGDFVGCEDSNTPSRNASTPAPSSLLDFDSAVEWLAPVTSVDVNTGPRGTKRQRSVSDTGSAIDEHGGLASGPEGPGRTEGADRPLKKKSSMSKMFDQVKRQVKRRMSVGAADIALPTQDPPEPLPLLVMGTATEVTGHLRGATEHVYNGHYSVFGRLPQSGNSASLGIMLYQENIRLRELYQQQNERFLGFMEDRLRRADGQVDDLMAKSLAPPATTAARPDQAPSAMSTPPPLLQPAGPEDKTDAVTPPPPPPPPPPPASRPPRSPTPMSARDAFQLELQQVVASPDKGLRKRGGIHK